MKKLIAVICAVALCCGGLAGCGDKKSEKRTQLLKKSLLPVLMRVSQMLKVKRPKLKS